MTAESATMYQLDENSVTAQYKEIVLSILDAKYQMCQVLTPYKWSHYKSSFYSNTAKLERFCQTHKDVLSTNACKTIFADLEKFHDANPPNSDVTSEEIENEQRGGQYDDSYGIYWGGPPK